MADTRLYELEECVSPQADDILLIEESATQTDKKVKLSELMPTDAVESAVADWLTAHPEATTTVEDGSITPVKLATSTMDLFDEKADTVGEYDDMTVGNAKQLLSKGYTENKTPYIYRKSAGGDRVYEKLIGGTIAWNQLCPIRSDFSGNGITLTNNSDGSYNVNGTAEAGMVITFGATFTVYQNHKYYIKGCPSDGGSNKYYFGLAGYVSETGSGAIFNYPSATSKQNARLDIKSGANISNAKIIPQVIDLTQMFGSTIADYIYSLEQATAGAGVAWFRALFPNDYYAYDSGSLQSVNVASKKVVGFNQWDEVWENGSISANDEPQNNGHKSHLRSKNYVPCMPNTTYYFMAGTSGYVHQYDSNKNLLKRDSFGNNGAFTTLSSARYIKFWVYKANDRYATYNHDICINISNVSKNGTYEPYEEHTYTFDSDVTLRGLPKLDSNNNLYYDGDVYESDGTVTRRYGIVDLGTLEWTKASNATRFYVAYNGIKVISDNTPANILCTKYITDSWNSVLTPKDKEIGASVGNYITIYDSSYNDATSFKTAMSGIYLVYELATPTTETADPYTNPQIVDADGTEEFVDYAYSQSTRDVAVPVGHESKYMINLRAKIEDAVMLPTLPTTNGTYTLKCIVASGTPTLSWVAD